MTLDEIFSELAAHFVEGVMLHSQMANYYGFLGLDGYVRCHEYHFIAESKTYRKLNEYYLKHHNRLIQDVRAEDPKVIPDNWIKYTRQDVDIDTKKNAIKTAMSKWVSWETDTKELLEKMYDELVEMNEIATALFIGEFVKDVDNELEWAEQESLDLLSVNYDMTYIVERQKILHDSFKSML